MKTFIPDYIEYPEETSNPFSTINKAIRNIHKKFPKVKAVEKCPHGQATGIELSSTDKDQLKKAFITVCFVDGEKHYNELVANGTLEDELESMDFYAWN